MALTTDLLARDGVSARHCRTQILIEAESPSAVELSAVAR
jgi:hypothetical protein